MKKITQGRIGIALVALQLLAYKGSGGSAIEPIPYQYGISAILPWLGGFLGFNFVGILGAVLIYVGFFRGRTTEPAVTPSAPVQLFAESNAPAEVAEADIPWEGSDTEPQDPEGEWHELNEWPKDADPTPDSPKS